MGDVSFGASQSSETWYGFQDDQTDTDNTYPEKLPETCFPKNSPAFVESFPFENLGDEPNLETILFFLSFNSISGVYVICIVLDELVALPPQN